VHSLPGAKKKGSNKNPLVTGGEWPKYAQQEHLISLYRISTTSFGQSNICLNKHHTASDCLTKEKQLPGWEVRFMIRELHSKWFNAMINAHFNKINNISIDQNLQLSRIIRTVLGSHQTSSTQQGYHADDPL